MESSPNQARSVNAHGKPGRTTLPIDHPAQLLLALKAEVDPVELVSTVDGIQNARQPGWFRSVHAHVLSWYLCASSDAEARKLFECCERLIALNAPLTDVEGPGAAVQFAGYPWPRDLQQECDLARLADLYLEAGLLDMHAPLPGGPPWTRKERREATADSHAGLTPLAAAIFMDDLPFARYLLARGVSRDLGVVYAGEPPTTAMELAAQESGEIHAHLVEELLNSRLAGLAPDGHQDASSVLRGRRMAI